MDSSILMVDTVEIRPSKTLKSRINYVDIEWSPRRLDAVFLLIEPFDPWVSHKPTAVWLTRSTPQLYGFCLPLAEAHFKAYGLEAWGHEGNFKVVSSYDVEWNTDGARVFYLRLQEHDESRSLLDCFGIEDADPFPIDIDLSGSFVEKLPIAGMSPSTQCLILCQQQEQRDKRVSFQEWILLKGQQLCSLPGRNLESVLPSRRDLGIKILALRKQTGSQFHLVSSASDVLHKNIYLNKADLEQLKAMALEHRRSLDLKFKKTTKVVPLRCFFRNKTPAYFEDIMDNRGGQMEVYQKDNNGDPDSSINHNINGLFFSAFLVHNSEQLPRFSPFGKRRLLIPAHILFTQDSNLYFADFYCDNPKNHYVTLVLTKQGSPTDDFCRKRLLPLDPKENPFLTRVPAQNPDQTGCSNSSAANEATVYVTLTYGLLVEVLYTENVDIEGLQSHGTATFADCKSDGTSSPDGNPKNKDCQRCNLAPIT